MDPKNVDLLLRIARQYRHEATDAGSLKEKRRLSALGLDYAKRALALAPKNSEAHLSVAISHAKAIELYGNREKMASLRQVKSFAESSLALDSRNHLAWYVLGRWHQRVADLGGVKRKFAEMTYGSLPKATNEEALKCYRKALAMEPNRSVYNVEMGVTYAAMGNKVEAKRYIEKGLAQPSTGKDDYGTKLEGQKVLKSLN
jgi:tetratricopeptide (TPR) repeat protein